MPVVTVIGDFMLDVLAEGKSTRVCPADGVPVITDIARKYRPGGAGNVAVMLAALGVTVRCVGVIGGDSQGRLLKSQLAEVCDTQNLVQTTEQPTTIRERLSIDGKTICRLDVDGLISSDDIRRRLSGLVVNVLVVCDHGLGGAAIIDRTSQQTFIDPACNVDFKDYAPLQATVIFPNRAESRGLSADQIAKAAAAQLCIQKLDADGICVSGDGWYSSHATRIIDTTGAGDQLLAAFVAARLRAHDFAAAIRLAHRAAGLQCQRSGCVPVTWSDLE